MMKTCCLLLALIGFCAAAEQKTISQPLILNGDYLVTSVGIGNPAQYFDLFLDIDDDKVLIMDTNTANPKLDYQYPYIKNLFEPTNSNTLNLTQNTCRRGYYDTSIHYVDGVYANDVITLGGNTYEKSVRFCEINSERTATDTSSDKMNWLEKMPFDGFLGLKPGGEDILEKVGFDSRQITFTVTDDGKKKPDDYAGYITFGGQDTTRCKNFRNFPANDYDSWKTWVTETKFNGKSSKGTYSTRFEFHNKTLVLPKTTYDQVVDYFGGKTYQIYCSSYTNIPNITLNIYGRDYSYPLTRQFIKTSDYYCKIDIVQASDSSEDQLVLNRYILDQYCLLFDYDNGVIALGDVNKP